jgi:FKBP-type peptidyl-prolyl cis-trans isomerase
MTSAVLLLLSAPAWAADWPVTTDAHPAAWTQIPTGVEIQDLEVGSGLAVELGSVASVTYTGMLADGTVFDSNVDGGAPLSFRVGEHRVIRGWEDGLVGMKVGGRRRLVIPASEGYGPRAVGPIPPDSVLYFEVELLTVTPPRKGPDQPSPVPDDELREVEGGGRYADLSVGDGPRAKKSWRVCLDYTSWRDGALVEHTYSRERCTWFRLDDDDLPPSVELGLARMRVGGVRQIQTPEGLVYEVQLVNTGK